MNRHPALLCLVYHPGHFSSPGLWTDGPAAKPSSRPSSYSRSLHRPTLSSPKPVQTESLWKLRPSSPKLSLLLRRYQSNLLVPNGSSTWRSSLPNNDFSEVPRWLGLGRLVDSCLAARQSNRGPGRRFHLEVRDVNGDVWKRLILVLSKLSEFFETSKFSFQTVKINGPLLTFQPNFRLFSDFFQTFFSFFSDFFRLFSDFFRLSRLFSDFFQIFFRLFSDLFQTFFRLFSDFFQTFFRPFQTLFRLFFRLFQTFSDFFQTFLDFY